MCMCKAAYNIPLPYLRIAKSLRAMGYEDEVLSPWACCYHGHSVSLVPRILHLSVLRTGLDLVERQSKIK